MHPTRTAEALLFATATDGLELTGVLFGDPAGNDLIALTHGSAARFCARGYVEIGRELARRDVALLSGDTRGRDVVAVEEVGGAAVAVGATFERFDASIADVGTWVDAARDLGPRRLIVAGHSMGGGKAVRALTSTSTGTSTGSTGTGVAGLLLLAPGVVWPANPDRQRIAADMVAAGRGGELMPPHPDGPVWNLISAATLAERATTIATVFDGAGSPWSTVDVPTLVLYGSDEEDGPDNIARLKAGWSSGHPLVCELVEGAGHDFRGYESRVADIVVEWLAGLGH